jgi:predicted Rossmann fold flavoprotein
VSYDVVVLGAGAAGCMAAIQAGKRGRKVLLIDQGRRVGGKIPISGGGRCNFTNRGAADGHYLGANPRFARSALAAFSAEDAEAWVAEAGIPFHEKTLGQLFCDRSALDIVGLLERDLRQAGVELGLNRKIDGLSRDGGFKVFGPGWEASAPKAVLALGGLSYPVLGAGDLAFRLARSFGLKVLECAPALDGFVFAAAEAARFEGLQGLALPAYLSAEGKAFDEAILFTHRGLSGPAALQGSLYWRPGQSVTVDLWPGQDAEAELLEYKRAQPRHSYEIFLEQRFPRRLAERWAATDPVGSVALVRLPDQALREAAARLKAWRFIPAGTVGWHKAEVTRGGVDTAELDQKTMECRKLPGLHIVGEAVDVTGELGGYNFQWAWSSGAAAGRNL